MVNYYFQWSQIDFKQLAEVIVA